MAGRKRTRQKPCARLNRFRSRPLQKERRLRKCGYTDIPGEWKAAYINWHKSRHGIEIKPEW
ncbi:MAG: hypothetical protein IKX78_00990, partial [Clostridia bacterium]|nr:hypothetical protein [Clostridia bacterium]